MDDSKINRPFCYKGRPYMRVESATTTMPQTAYNDLLLQRDGNRYRWELLENRNLTLQDLDTNEVLKTVRLGIECGRLPEDTGTDLPVILGKFGLLKDGVLNNAAAVLFGKHEDMEYPQCLLRLARFKGTDKLYSWTANAFKATFSTAQCCNGIYFQASILIRHDRYIGTGGTSDHSIQGNKRRCIEQPYPPLIQRSRWFRWHSHL